MVFYDILCKLHGLKQEMYLTYLEVDLTALTVGDATFVQYL